MKGHRVAMTGGAVWQLFRFLAVFFFTLRVGPTDDPVFHITLLWLGAGTVILAGMFFMTGRRRHLESGYLPFLRIGGALNVLVDAAVVISQGYLRIDERLGFATPETRLVFFSVFGIMVVDLLILAALIAYKGRGSATEAETGG